MPPPFIRIAAKRSARSLPPPFPASPLRSAMRRQRRQDAAAVKRKEMEAEAARRGMTLEELEELEDDAHATAPLLRHLRVHGAPVETELEMSP